MAETKEDRASHAQLIKGSLRELRHGCLIARNALFDMAKLKQRETALAAPLLLAEYETGTRLIVGTMAMPLDLLPALPMCAVVATGFVATVTCYACREYIWMLVGLLATIACLVAMGLLECVPLLLKTSSLRNLHWEYRWLFKDTVQFKKEIEEEYHTAHFSGNMTSRFTELASRKKRLDDGAVIDKDVSIKAKELLDKWMHNDIKRDDRMFPEV